MGFCHLTSRLSPEKNNPGARLIITLRPRQKVFFERQSHHGPREREREIERERERPKDGAEEEKREGGGTVVQSWAFWVCGSAV